MIDNIIFALLAIALLTFLYMIFSSVVSDFKEWYTSPVKMA